jgi:hypothetical protein
VTHEGTGVDVELEVEVAEMDVVVDVGVGFHVPPQYHEESLVPYPPM